MSKTRNVSIVLLAFMLATISCATSTQLGDRTPSGVTLLNPAIRYSAVHPDNVMVILNEAQLEGVEYDLIALIEETSHGGLFSPPTQGESGTNDRKPPTKGCPDRGQCNTPA